MEAIRTICTDESDECAHRAVDELLAMPPRVESAIQYAGQARAYSKMPDVILEALAEVPQQDNFEEGSSSEPSKS